jgi:uncharacterized protein YjeT (DUF2065 family)
MGDMKRSGGGNMESVKCVIVVDRDLPMGLKANAAAALALSLGSRVGEDLIGPDTADRDGRRHPGITRIGLPILEAPAEAVKEIYEAVPATPEAPLRAIGFSALAQSCRDYGDYEARMGRTPSEELRYSGVCLYGPPREVARLTGSLRMLR